MVNYSAALDTTFGMLSHPIRRAILHRLTNGRASVKELAAPFNISLPALLKHLSKLEKAGLVRSEKQGRVHTCELNAEPLREASDWLAHYQQFWDTKLDALEHFLDSEPAEPDNNEGNS